MRHSTIESIAMAVVFGVPLGAATAVWWQLLSGEREDVINIVAAHPSAVVSALFLLLAGLAAFVHWVFHRYIYPLDSIVEQSILVTTVNPSHRITSTGNQDLDRLTALINVSSDRILGLQQGITDRVHDAQADLESEKEMLAALVHQLADGILVCSSVGQIVLYNRVAVDLFSGSGKAHPEGGEKVGLVGLGRSVFGCIDRSVIAHAIQEIRRKLGRGEPFPEAHFVITGSHRELLRVRTVPVHGQKEPMNGFILVLNDVTQQMAHDSRRDELLHTLMEAVRTSLTAIRSAVESLDEYRDMEVETRTRLVSIVKNESLSLSDHLERSSTALARAVTEHKHLENALCEEILDAFERSAGQSLDIQVIRTSLQEHLQIRVDSYMIIQLLLFITNELKRLTGSLSYGARAGSIDAFAFIDVFWTGVPLPMETMRNWEQHQLMYEGRGAPSTVGDVLRHHGAELWSQSDDNGRAAFLRILFPAGEPYRIDAGENRVEVRSRPEFYDFDLFKREEEVADIYDRTLDKLTYTAFDTETTGLLPSEGDEIISIGAVRILNGKILRGEVFERLVDPGRALSPETIRITNIRPEMLVGQPPIGKVLPALRTFVEGTVLVAHNAAFDLRFFQMKQETTGVRLPNPLLDTLLLSAVVHPEQQAHEIEAIAHRLGVDIIGRHTALGDALVTAELFLKLLPLLAEKQITTLRQAHDASRKTYYARLKY